MSTPDPAETTTGARALYETLRACGVTHLFGLDSPEPLYAELDRAEMRPITEPPPYTLLAAGSLLGVTLHLRSRRMAMRR